MSSGAGVVVTFLGSGARVKKSDSDHLRPAVNETDPAKYQQMNMVAGSDSSRNPEGR